MKKLIKTVLVVLILLVGGFAGYVYMINRPLSQNEYDAAILERTIELLSDEAGWSKSGDRSCDADEQMLNLYCALRRASIEVAGEFKHRAAALQEVRHAIERQNPRVDYAHRLMDYNDDQGTSFEELHAVLQDALDNLRARKAMDA